MKSSLVFSIFALSCLAACNGYELGLIHEYEGTEGEVLPDDDAGPACYSKKYQQPEESRVKDVDLLFVVDTSGSLDEERAKIAAQIDSYVAKLPADANIRIGVMLGHGPQSKWMGKLYTYKSSNFVLDTAKQSMAEIRTELGKRLSTTATDSYSDGGETLFVSLYQGLRGGLLAESKAHGFFRDEAALAVIFISDENEICYQYQNGVKRVRDAESFQGLPLEIWAFNHYCSVPSDDGSSTQNLSYKVMLSELKKLKGQQPMLVASMVYTDANNFPKTGENEYGWGYVELAQEAGGGVVNLADPDYSKSLAFIGELTATRLNLVTEFKLDHTNVDPASIKVAIDAEPAFFTYSGTTNSITVNEPGQANSEVDINYCLRGEGNTDPGTDAPQCPVSDPTCGGIGI
jgi:hypothetical protein